MKSDEIFPFKTRDMRALLLLGICFSLTLWGATFGLLELNRDGKPTPTWFECLFATVVTSATLCGLWTCLRGQIRLGERGIEWRLPFGKRFVAWEEIDALIVNKGCFLIVGARKISLYPDSLPPADVYRLLEIVEKRAINARGGWESATKTMGEQTLK